MEIDSFLILKELIRDTSLLSGELFFKQVVATISRLFGADLVFIAYHKNPKSDAVDILGVWERGKELAPWSFSLPGTPCEVLYDPKHQREWKKIEVGGSVIINKDLRDRFESMKDTQYEVFIGVPLSTEEGIIGHVALFFEKKGILDTEMESIVELIELFSFRIQGELIRLISEKEKENTLQKLESLNLRLKLESITDPLTQIYNRRYFTSRNQEAFSQYKRDGMPYALLILDIDHFKKVNDEFGHNIGDQVLSRVASVLLANCRSDIELLFRIGGEEFAILCQKNITPSGLSEFTKRLNQVFRSYQIPELPGKQITVSIGASMPEKGDVSWNTLYSRADAALYEAKESGRDRAVIRCS